MVTGREYIRSERNRELPTSGSQLERPESKSFARSGRTICINPVSEYGEGILAGVILTWMSESPLQTCSPIKGDSRRTVLLS